MKFIICFMAAGALSGCGLINLAEEMKDEVKGTHEEVKQTNLHVQQTNQEVAKTNDQMLKMKAETEELRKLTQALVTKMDRTNEGVHLQILTLSLQGLTSEYATAVLVPPVRMMPYAKEFAHEGSATEILEVLHTLYTEVRLAYSREEGGDLRINQRRTVWAAAGAIAGLAPKEKIQEIFDSNLARGGRLEDTAGVIGLLRFNFIRDYLIGPMIDENKPVNLETLRATADYLESLNHLVKLPYRDRFQVKVEKYAETLSEDGSTTFEQYSDAVSAKQVLQISKKALRKYDPEKSATLKSEDGQVLPEAAALYQRLVVAEE